MAESKANVSTAAASKADFFHGVNLGNWLVLEKWMSPQTFSGSDADDEYYLPRTLARASYEARIVQHRAEYISERDFVLLRGMGITSVRIPVPYFIFGDREPFIGCIADLDNAFAWGEQYGISILIDLHTAPMSQNGFDNGGIQGVCRFSQLPEEVEFVLTVLERLAQRYGSHPALYGIQILNEPITERMWNAMNILTRYPPREPELSQGSAPNSLSFLRDFYTEAYARIAPHLAAGKKVVFHDGFELLAWQDFMVDRTKYPNVVLDTHQYLMMAEMGDCEQKLESYLDYLEHKLTPQYREVTAVHDVICGEWCLFNSLACGYDTKGGQSVLNGVTADAATSGLSLEERTAIYQELNRAQLKIWHLGVGHYYWNYKILFDTVNTPFWRGWDAWDAGRSYAFNWFQLV